MGEQRTARRWADAPTSTISAAGAGIVYRELGPRTGVPLVALTHLGANLDDWDPRIMDGLAEERHVIAIGYRGVGRSTGQVRGSIETMAADVVAAVEALGHERVDLFGQSMGGLARLEERTTDRDAAVSLAVLRAQLGAVRRWGALPAQDLSAVTGAVLVVHGDSDVLVPPVDADQLVRRLPSADLHMLPDAGHGAVAQHGRQVIATMLDHLRRPTITHHHQEKTS